MRPFSQIERSSEITALLAKYGFHELIEHSPFRKQARKHPEISEDKELLEPLSRPKKFRHLLQDLGTTFIKVGQLLSTRPDLLPEEYTDELEQLQDGVVALPFSDIKKHLEEVYPQPLENYFAHIEEDALAAASIAQVHRARLTGGEEVVVKIKRPGIDRIVRADLDILEILVDRFLKNRPGWRIQQPGELMSYFRDLLEKELDMLSELANMERARRQKKDEDDCIQIPRVFRRFSNREVLVMEYIDGEPMSSVSSNPSPKKSKPSPGKSKMANFRSPSSTSDLSLFGASATNSPPASARPSLPPH